MSIREELGFPIHGEMSEEQLKAYYRARTLRFRRLNPDKCKESDRKSRLKHPEKVKARTQKWRNENRARYLATNLARQKLAYADPIKRAAMIARVRDYTAKRKLQDPAFRVLLVQRSRLSGLLKGTSWKKSSKTLSFSTEELRDSIQRKFLNGMTWENYGIGEGKWHIDHIVPCSQFDLTKLEEVKKCFSLANLQPLWGRENIQKSNKVLKQTEMVLTQ